MKSEKKKRWSFRGCMEAIFLQIWLRTFYIGTKKTKEYNGWFVRKRPITMIILSPILMPVFMIGFMFYGAYYYVKWATTWYYSWIHGENAPLTFEQKTFIKKHLYFK